MSSRLIEAKFRALDEAIEGMYKSKQVAPEAFRKAFSRHRNIHLNRLPNSTLNSTRADSQRPERPKSSSWSREGNLKVGGPASPLIESARNLPKRCTSAGQRKAIKNWFAPSSNNTPSMSSPIVKPKTVIEAFRSSELNDSITISHDHPISDPSFYHFEIRLDHPRNLQGWLFHGRFTDTSDPKKPTVELWNLEVDEYNFVKFHDRFLTQNFFDPFRYFTHIKSNEQLYMHELHVELYATSPVRHRVVDTIISFTHEKDIHSSRIDFDQITSTVQSNRYGVNRNQDAHIEITEDEQDSIGECAEIVIGECSSNVIREHTVHHPVQKSTVFSIEEAKLELTSELAFSVLICNWLLSSQSGRYQLLVLKGDLEARRKRNWNHHIQLEQQLKTFWTKQLAQMEQLEVGSEQDFKNHNDLPLARIKRIMKSDEDVRMISAEAPVLFAKACEMFILELTLRSWSYSERNKRRTLQKEDIQTAIRNTDIFDFLVDVIN
ncbi:hypothetical protein ABG067_004884 [Albugo candida]